MLSFVSARKMSITACESSPSAAQSAPISLPNTTFRAWKLLSTYFVISATGIGTRNRGPPRPVVQAHHLRTAALVALADDRLRRILEVPHAAALAQELRVDTDAEVDPDALAGSAFQHGDQHLLARTGDHGAAKDHDVPAVLRCERGADLVARPFQIPRGQAAARCRRCAHTDDRDVRAQHRRRRIVRDRQPSAVTMLGRELADPLLDHRCDALAEEVGLLWIDVDADDRVSPGREARGGDTSHVAETEDTDCQLAARVRHLSHHSCLSADDQCRGPSRRSNLAAVRSSSSTSLGGSTA